MRFCFETPVPLTGEPAYWFFFRESQILLRRSASGVAIPMSGDIRLLRFESGSPDYFGSVDGQPCYLAGLPESLAIPEGYELRGLRQLFGEIDETLFWAAGRAAQIRHWDQTHRYCGRCGRPMVRKEDERAKLCPDCGQIFFPRISPAVIVAITRDDQILLAVNVRSSGQFYSVLAGFVEPGENLEECVRREVKEEVGIEVKNIRYFGSQPWPFPDSLMVGFTAEYAGGEICIDPGEIAHADWFTADQLPNLPGRISIARRLIDWFRERYR